MVRATRPEVICSKLGVLDVKLHIMEIVTVLHSSSMPSFIPSSPILSLTENYYKRVVALCEVE